MPVSKELSLELSMEENTIETSSCQILYIPPNQIHSLVLNGQQRYPWKFTCSPAISNLRFETRSLTEFDISF